MSWRIKPLHSINADVEGSEHRLERSLGALQLMLLGVGGIIGTGIFVLTAEATQKAGPGMMFSFVIAGTICAVAALCYAELAAMAPVSGSAYTYTYAVMGEVLAWMVGWALILEYIVAAGAVSVGWSGYIVGIFEHTTGITPPIELVKGPFQGGVVNVPAMFIALLMTVLLMIGTKESARFNAVLVVAKILALSVFIMITITHVQAEDFTPLLPNGWGILGVGGAAASIFFAYIGFDAVSTAAEETHNPQRNVPIGLIGSLAICTIFYIFVAMGAIGVMGDGAQPVRGLEGQVLSPGTIALSERCQEIAAQGLKTLPLACSHEALAHVLRVAGHDIAAYVIGLVAGLALPSVVLMMIFGQTRIFFVMARDGLLPKKLARIHKKWRTPHIMTLLTGGFVALSAAFFPVGILADICNSGTLFAFLMVSLAVLILRVTEPNHPRPFRTPLVWIIAPISAVGCVALYFLLPFDAKMVFPIWGIIGLACYFAYGYRKSPLAPHNQKS